MLIDKDGRFFGKWNIIDVFVALFIIGIVGGFIFQFGRFRTKYQTDMTIQSEALIKKLANAEAEIKYKGIYESQMAQRDIWVRGFEEGYAAGRRR